jgi:hypothetical protein
MNAGATDTVRVGALGCAFVPLREGDLDIEPDWKRDPFPVAAHGRSVATVRGACTHFPHRTFSRLHALFDGNPHEHLQQDQVRNLW